MNRRFLFGCLGVVGLAAVVGLIVLYINVIRPTREIMGDLRQLGTLSELNEQVVEKGPFVPPAEGELSADQLERFAAVQTAMRAELGNDYDEIRRRAEKLRGMNRADDGSVTKPGFREVIASFKGLGPLLERAKAAQVDALNAEGFSYPEYRWVRETVYASLGKKSADVYLEEFAERVLGLGNTEGETSSVAATEVGTPGGDSEREPGESAGETPADSWAEGITPVVAGDSPRNRILAAAFTDSLSAWEPFLVFGL